MDFKVKLYLLCLGFQAAFGFTADVANELLGQPFYKLDLKGYVIAYIAVTLVYTLSYFLALAILKRGKE